MTWEEYFFFLQQKHVFGVALALINKSKCLKKISQSWKKPKNIECFFFLKWRTAFFVQRQLVLSLVITPLSFCRMLRTLVCYLLLVLINLRGLQIYLGGRKEDLKTNFAFESVHLFLLNAQSRCLYKLEAVYKKLLNLCFPGPALNCLPDCPESTWTQRPLCPWDWCNLSDQ